MRLIDIEKELSKTRVPQVQPKTMPSFEWDYSDWLVLQKNKDRSYIFYVYLLFQGNILWTKVFSLDQYTGQSGSTFGTMPDLLVDLQTHFSITFLVCPSGSTKVKPRNQFSSTRFCSGLTCTPACCMHLNGVVIIVESITDSDIWWNCQSLDMLVVKVACGKGWFEIVPTASSATGHSEYWFCWRSETLT